MDNRKLIDSTYGSFSGFLSSNSNSSSYSMSVSDSEFPEELPSTSGCSSDFANNGAIKEKRKEKLKQYLKQLKQMVNPEPHIGHQVSTLGALKHVISSMQKTKEETITDPNDPEKCINICTPFSSSTSEDDTDLHVLSLTAKNDLQILVNLKSLKILQVSPALKKILGYPMDSWTGRDLTNFLHRKDVVSVNSSYTYEDPERYENQAMTYNDDGNATSVDPAKRVIYCRIRHYKTLKTGFSIEKKDQYSPFHVTVTTKTVNDDSEKQKQYLLLECRPLSSAYKNWAELPPDKKTFSTRHSLFCSYTYIHPNAIPLLGFLPQDMVGMSIFDFYHSEDFELLYNIYKQVVNLKGATFQSPKLRLRTHNGDWIYVVTEWSRFINPWSKRLEFIIGQHTVVKGPHNPAVFSSPQNQECITEDPEQYHQNLRMIRQLLLQPVVDEARSVALNIEDEPRDMPVSVSPSQDGGDKDSPAGEGGKKYRTVPGSIGCRQILDENLSGTYEQLNYTNNIKRFLMSQPKTYSSSSGKRSGDESTTDESNAIDSDEVPDFEVDIPYPKPPSFCSSTKVLVSEKEDMVPSPSCQTEEIGEETIKEVQAPTPVQEEPNVLMSLTQETLQEHTKRQEKLYLELAKQDSNLVLLNMSSKHSVIQDSSHGLKRGHSPDIDQVQNYKSFKGENINILHPPFPVSTVEGNVRKTEGTNPKMAFSNLYRIGMSQSPSTMFPNSTIPIAPMMPQNVVYTSAMVTLPSTGSKTSNLQWPYYPQPGLSFIPQVMGGFFHQPTFTYATPVWTSSDSKLVRATKPQDIFTQAGEKASLMSVSDQSSGDNSSSSLMYLLELNNTDTSQALVKSKVLAKSQKRGLEPPWLFGVLWIEGIQMRYTMPRRKFNRVMKEDRDKLNMMNQSDLLLQQMSEFKEDLQKSNIEPTEDEEADYLFIIEQNQFKDEHDDSSSDLSDKLECSMNFNFEESKTENMTKQNCEMESKSGTSDEINMSVSGNQDSVSDHTDEHEKKSEADSDSIPKSGDNDSSVDMESTCSKSSDLTPSDARSTDDKGSSMKESDSQSQKLSNKDSESENDLNQSKEPLDEFDGFFIKNPSKFKHSKKGFWLEEASMNDRITMEYSVKSDDDILLKDLRRLNEMNQSAVVKDQLSCLLEDLKTTKSFEHFDPNMCGHSSGAIPSKSQECSNCLNNENMFSNSKYDFFESLFMQPLFTNMEDGSTEIPHSPDMDDLCDIIDSVD